MHTRPIRILLILLLIHSIMLAWGAVVHSPTIDEVEWLPGGLAQLETGRGDIVIRNPPHVGLIAAMPLLFAKPDMTALKSGAGARVIGREFIRQNGARSFWLFTLGRWACIPFSIVGAIACYTWARDLYGPKSGILAATLWCFCPNVLAHGQLVAHDVATTSLGLVACYAFWRWLCQPTLKTTVTAGVCLGLALLTKMTMLIHFALWPLMWISWCAGRADERRLSRSWLVSGAMLAAILILAIDVLNLGYGFQGSLNSLNSYRFRSHALAGTSDGPGNRFADSVLGELPIPLPCAFLAGLDLQRFSQEGRTGSRGSYLRGEWSAGGTPYYYLYALAIKVPLGTWCLLLLASLVRLCRVDAQNHVRDEVVLLAPTVAILLVASKSAGYADHLRYVLPCFPFVFIWISRLGMRVSTHQSLGKAVIAATVWTALSSLWIYPHSLSFFNEIVGGPRYGHYHLASSNIDYGQDLLKLRSWYDQHPDARPLGLAYWDLDSVDPRLAGLTYYVSPSGTAPSTTVMSHGAKQLGPIPGWHAVNVNTLHGDTWPGRSSYPDWGFYGYFLEFTPVARAGYSILIYNITVDEANRVRAEMDLPLIDPLRN